MSQLSILTTMNIQVGDWVATHRGAARVEKIVGDWAYVGNSVLYGSFLMSDLVKVPDPTASNDELEDFEDATIEG